MSNGVGVWVLARWRCERGTRPGKRGAGDQAPARAHLGGLGRRCGAARPCLAGRRLLAGLGAGGDGERPGRGGGPPVVGRDPCRVRDATFDGAPGAGGGARPRHGHTAHRRLPQDGRGERRRGDAGGRARLRLEAEPRAPRPGGRARAARSGRPRRPQAGGDRPAPAGEGRRNGRHRHHGDRPPGQDRLHQPCRGAHARLHLRTSWWAGAPTCWRRRR